MDLGNWRQSIRSAMFVWFVANGIYDFTFILVIIKRPDLLEPFFTTIMVVNILTQTPLIFVAAQDSDLKSFPGGSLLIESLEFLRGPAKRNPGIAGFVCGAVNLWNAQCQILPIQGQFGLVKMRTITAVMAVATEGVGLLFWLVGMAMGSDTKKSD
mmetsp:Transcript_16846/g.31310  ORF Transcript_16846/g.31310 Transcript_16846/m.31310 type:complete len:156 (+) Transcript_16846:96-563(+)